MALFCPKDGCKEKTGPCNCEKIAGAVVFVIAAGVLIKYLA